MSIGKLDEMVENLFENFKQLTAKKHFQGGLSKEENQVLAQLGTLSIAGAKESNMRTGLFRWRTDLPSVKECFAREMDDNQPVSDELRVAVCGEPEAPTPPPPAENPAPASADGASEKKTRKGRLSEEVVADIRSLLAKKPGEEGYLKQGEIAKKHGIDPSTVSDIKVGRGRYGKDAVVKEDASQPTQSPEAAVPSAATAAANNASAAGSFD